MAKVSVVSPERVREVPPPDGYTGLPRALAYLDGDGQPLHLHRHDLAAGERLRIGPMETDCLAYVWLGAVEANGCALPAGSSLVVEHGRMLEIVASDPATLLAFAAAKPDAAMRAGGHVHLLPADRVPRSADLGSSGVGGGMHCDSGCPTCAVWLHENHFPPAKPLTDDQQKQGIHAHSEDEIIFVTGGSMMLGGREAGPGTALFVAAETLYSFSPGPQGLSFINFRSGTPGDIRFANGMAISETDYWRDRLPRPDYVMVD